MGVGEQNCGGAAQRHGSGPAVGVALGARDQSESPPRAPAVERALVDQDFRGAPCGMGQRPPAMSRLAGGRAGRAGGQRTGESAPGAAAHSCPRCPGDT